MRLRNIPRAESVLEACKEVVKNPESLCGHWNQEFQNERPLHIEIGMGTSASNAIPASYYVPLRNSRNWKPKEKILPTSDSSVWMRMTCRRYSPRRKYPVST